MLDLKKSESAIVIFSWCFSWWPCTLTSTPLRPLQILYYHFKYSSWGIQQNVFTIFPCSSHSLYLLQVTWPFWPWALLTLSIVMTSSRIWRGRRSWPPDGTSRTRAGWNPRWWARAWCWRSWAGTRWCWCDHLDTTRAVNILLRSFTMLGELGTRSLFLVEKVPTKYPKSIKTLC